MSKKNPTQHSLTSGQTIYTVVDPFGGGAYISTNQVRSKVKTNHLGVYVDVYQKYASTDHIYCLDHGIGGHSSKTSRARSFYSRKRALTYLKWIKSQPVKPIPPEMMYMQVSTF